MDDDQFHGNLNVQGGNPEPRAPIQQESDMSQRMNEILSGGYNPATQQPVAPTPVAPVATPITMQQQSSEFETVPGVTPVMTGVPRSSVEQQAAEQAARDAVAAAESKKISPKVIIGIIVGVLLVATAVVVVAVMLDGGKKKEEKKDDTQSQVEPDPEPEPTVEMQRIGTAEHGYISVPKDWDRVIELEDETGFWYGDKEAKTTVTSNSAAKTTTVTAKALAESELAVAKSKTNISQPQMVTEKHGSYEMHKVFYFRTDTKRWTFEYLFEAEDERVHCLLLKTADNTNSLITSIPDSWSLNQNSDGEPVSNPDDEKKEEKTDNKADDKTDDSSSDTKKTADDSSAGDTAE